MPPGWTASMNAQELGRYPDQDTAVKRVEELIESEMRLAISDWEIYLTSKNTK
jgi:hypothetical protein